MKIYQIVDLAAPEHQRIKIKEIENKIKTLLDVNEDTEKCIGDLKCFAFTQSSEITIGI